MSTHQRAAIVTGASTGIGLAVATALCEDGFAVTMSARREARLLAAAEPLRARGFEVETVSADASGEGAAEALVIAHLARFERLDVVVANAGWGNGGSVAESRAEDLERMLAINVAAPFALAKAAIPTMRRGEDGRGGDGDAPSWFVITSSIAGDWPTAGFAAYAASKAASVSLARSIAAEEATAGVRACAIMPAFVATDMTAWLGDTLPAAEMLDAADVAETIRFLLRLSPAASVTEVVLRRATALHPHAP
ncbi:MAG: short-chain dehydrogenase [Aeromicrobium sp.]|nr:short-chain dehydrogenase [Ilumatobacteraceae bacterium]MCW2801393.1 short-chain dehydrogenase [Aeromicrobium sp.]